MSSTRDCPECAEEILVKARKCKHCGSAITPIQNTPAEKKPREKPGCLGSFVRVVLGVVGFFGAVGLMFALAAKMADTSATPSKTSRLEITLSDGSLVTFSNLRSLPDWACGSRQSATFEGGDVVLYFDRSGDLVSANIPAAGNEKFYERDASRSCVKNWQSGKFELLTDREFKRYEKKAGIPSQ